MNITDVKIRKLFLDGGKVKAVASIIVGVDFAVHDLKVIQGIERLFVAMPTQHFEDGSFSDVAHPISQTARRQVESAVLDAYEKELKSANSRSE